MKHYEYLVIGFGKGGKTLAGALAGEGHRVALIEKDAGMFGGTCINVACIPSKYLENQARLSAVQGGDFAEKARRYAGAIAGKRSLTAALRKKNYDKVVSSGAEVLVGTASFVDAHTVEIAYPDESRESVQADFIFLNTGARPILPKISGLSESKFVYTSETMMELDALPARLVIIGGGYIGLEFASYYTNFGSQVTLLQHGNEFIPREDREVAAAVLENLRKRGITVLEDADTQQITDAEDHAVLTVNTPDGPEILEAEAVLAAAGRRPNLDGLHLENAGVALTERGAVQADEHLQTSVPHIYAMGDVTGGQQFTYISLDDSRIVRSALTGDESRTTKNRGSVPYSVFLDPPLSRVGLTEAEARAQYPNVGVAKISAVTPKSKILGQSEGLLKAIVNLDDGMILGAHLFCAESHELINLVKLAMDAGLSYTVLRDNIYTHPTMAEALNDLFAAVR